MTTRQARSLSDGYALSTIRQYLPANYEAVQDADGTITVTGVDNAGWTLEGYVIPRLASGLYWFKEVTTCMRSIESMQVESVQRGRLAEEYGLEPQEVTDFESIRSIPFLGDYEPPGWEFVESHFVDGSGFGRPGEPAMTSYEFHDLASATDNGFGIFEAGQFQVKIREFRRTT